MRKHAFTVQELLVVIAIIMIFAAVLFPKVGYRPGSAQRSSCQSNLHQISLGIKQYMQDFDEKFPLVQSGGQGWADLIQPYVKSTQIFQCPTEKSGKTAGKSDYFYNARLAGQRERKLTFLGNTIMSGDGTGESASNSSLTGLPESWRTDTYSPAYRHIDGANYAFADGHMKWVKPEKITNEKASETVWTFALW